jgi:hypothetical protein
MTTLPQLAVTGTMLAGSFHTVQMPATAFTLGTTTTVATLPSVVLTAGGAVDLYKLATYNLSAIEALAAQQDAIVMRVDSLEVRLAQIELDSSGSYFSAESLMAALGNLKVTVANGVAQFGTLVSRQFVASKDSDGTSSAASVTVLAGNTEVQINSVLVQPSTKVFITFTSQVTGSWWVSEKVAGSFKLMLSAPQTSDVAFDYFLVQTEGQISTPQSATSSTVYSVTQSAGTTTTTPVVPTTPLVQPPTDTTTSSTTTPPTDTPPVTPPADTPPEPTPPADVPPVETPPADVPPPADTTSATAQ